jgi:energy-coupling factor transporter ATP-binding protein EcfA2
MTRDTGHAAEPELRTVGLGKDFAGFTAVGRVDLAVRSGDVHVLVGPNGAGKTTLFNLLTGFHRPSRGRILLGGADITGASTELRARQPPLRALAPSNRLNRFRNGCGPNRGRKARTAASPPKAFAEPLTSQPTNLGLATKASHEVRVSDRDRPAVRFPTIDGKRIPAYAPGRTRADVRG